MFDGRRYKKFAIIQLQKRWKVPVLASLLFALVFTLLQFKEVIFAVQGIDNSAAKIFTAADIIRSCAFTLSWYIFVFAQLYLYIKMSRSPEVVKFADFVQGFAMWRRAVAGGLWNFAWISLWSCFLVIPGVIKSYEYSLMWQIMVEFPNVGVDKSMRMSKILTNGHKADLLALQLSFIPWAVLCVMTAGVGFVFLAPYYQMTMVNAYHALLKEGLEMHKIEIADIEEAAPNVE